MAYSARADIEARFGLTAVDKWADLDGGYTEPQKTARITAAIAWADAEIDERLRSSAYEVPFSPVPHSVETLSVDLAACWLYESRGAQDMDADGEQEDRLTPLRKKAYARIRAILMGQIALDATAAVVAPFHVETDLTTDLDATAPDILTIP